MRCGRHRRASWSLPGPHRPGSSRTARPWHSPASSARPSSSSRATTADSQRSPSSSATFWTRYSRKRPDPTVPYHCCRQLIVRGGSYGRQSKAGGGRSQGVGNAVVHFEIGGPDDQPLVEFYQELFGWQMKPMGGGGYTLIDTCGGGGINGGIGRSRTGEPWSTFYVAAQDPQATLDQVAALGGTVVMPVTDFGGAVTIAMFHDPDGLLVGVVKAESGSQDSPPGPSAGDGAPVDWFEVLGSAAERTQRFYCDLFGWTADTASFA